MGREGYRAQTQQQHNRYHTDVLVQFRSYMFCFVSHFVNCHSSASCVLCTARLHLPGIQQHAFSRRTVTAYLQYYNDVHCLLNRLLRFSCWRLAAPSMATTARFSTQPNRHNEFNGYTNVLDATRTSCVRFDNQRHRVMQSTTILLADHFDTCTTRRSEQTTLAATSTEPTPILTECNLAMRRTCVLRGIACVGYDPDEATTACPTIVRDVDTTPLSLQRELAFYTPCILRANDATCYGDSACFFPRI
jgi:hypothetical protein